MLDETPAQLMAVDPGGCLGGALIAEGCLERMGAGVTLAEEGLHQIGTAAGIHKSIFRRLHEGDRLVAGTKQGLCPELVDTVRQEGSGDAAQAIEAVESKICQESIRR